MKPKGVRSDFILVSSEGLGVVSGLLRVILGGVEAGAFERVEANGP